jgi:cytochrome P450
MYYIHDLHEKYGPFVRVSPDEISVSDIDAFGQIHRISSGFLKSKWYNDLVPFERLTIFLMVDPKAHSERRRLLARAFSKTYLRTHWESTVRSMVDRAVERMGEDAQKNGTVDVLKWFTFMATDISSHLMFGDSLRMIERGEVRSYLRLFVSR